MACIMHRRMILLPKQRRFVGCEMKKADVEAAKPVIVLSNVSEMLIYCSNITVRN